MVNESDTEETVPQPEAAAQPTAAEVLDRPTADSPLVGRLLILTGAGGLCVALFLGLWVSDLRVDRSVTVQVDTTWIAGERLAARTQVFDGDLRPIPGARARLLLHSAGSGPIHDLGTLEPVASTGIAQGHVNVPALEAGRHTLELDYKFDGLAFTETIPIEVAPSRPVRLAKPTISTHSLQWADDTDPQIEPLEIVLRPVGRIVAGFRNEFIARVTHADGRPWVGPLELVLHDGEYLGQRARDGEIVRLALGQTNHLGLLGVAGPLASEVVRLGVRVVRAEDSKVVHERKFRFVSYAGAVAVDVDPILVSGGDPVDIHARGLGTDRPVFVDIFAPDGSWIDTFQPPVFGGEPPRPWNVPKVSGVVQIEAYHFTTKPSESAAVATLQVTSPSAVAPMAQVIELQRSSLSIPRIERDFDKTHETAYLEHVAKELAKGTWEPLDHRWLLGTLPVRVQGPPVALTTRLREDEAMAARKRFWKLTLRSFLLGGGGFYLIVLTLLMTRAHGQAAASTLRALEQLGLDVEDVHAHVTQARRAALLRGLGVLGVMAAALVLTLVMLENLL